MEINLGRIHAESKKGLGKKEILVLSKGGEEMCKDWKNKKRKWKTKEEKITRDRRGRIS